MRNQNVIKNTSGPRPSSSNFISEDSFSDEEDYSEEQKKEDEAHHFFGDTFLEEDIEEKLEGLMRKIGRLPLSHSLSCKVILRYWSRQPHDPKGYYGHLSLEIPLLETYISIVPNKHNNPEASTNIKWINSYSEDRKMMGYRDADQSAILRELRISDLLSTYYLYRKKTNEERFRYVNVSRLLPTVYNSVNAPSYSYDDKLNCTVLVKSLLEQSGMKTKPAYRPTYTTMSCWFCCCYIIPFSIAFALYKTDNISRKDMGYIVAPLFSLYLLCICIPIVWAIKRTCFSRTELATPDQVFRLAKKYEKNHTSTFFKLKYALKKFPECKIQSELDERAKLEISDNRFYNAV